MANRKERAAIAAQTVDILNQGWYQVDSAKIDITQKLQASCNRTQLYTPKQLEELLLKLSSTTSHTPVISVKNQTTFAGVQELMSEGYQDVACLNFASANNPGGGFLSGSQAQEECLARASGLYATLQTQPDYYQRNRSCNSALYTSHAIYSPQVPVFRDDTDQLLSCPYFTSIITSPAVNAGAIKRNEPDNISKIENIMRQRIESIFAIAFEHQHEALVLGAWGCGVFGNNPTEIAQWFQSTLSEHPIFSRAFKRVHFSVLDYATETPTHRAFESIFK